MRAQSRRAGVLASGERFPPRGKVVKQGQGRRKEKQPRRAAAGRGASAPQARWRAPRRCGVVDGSDAAPALLQGGFSLTTFDAVQACGPDPDCEEAQRTEGGGFVSAVVLNLKSLVALPVKRNVLAKVEYALIQDVGPVGTTIACTDRLANRGSYRVPYLVNVDGQSKCWSTGVDGVVQKGSRCSNQDFRRGNVGVSKPGESHPADADSNIVDCVRILQVLFLDAELFFDCDKAADLNDDGQVTIGDAVGLLTFLFRGGLPPPPPFFELGPDPTPDALSCCGYPQ